MILKVLHRMGSLMPRLYSPIAHRIGNGIDLARSSACPKMVHTSVKCLANNPMEFDPEFFDPPDLFREPDIPEEDELYIQLRGYDFAVLESFSKYCHAFLRETFQLETDTWPCPPKTTHIQRYRPNTIKLDAEFDLALHERVIQITDVPSTKMSVLLNVITTNLPEGVSMKVAVDEDDPEHRFIPDQQLDLLRGELDRMQEERDAKKKK